MPVDPPLRTPRSIRAALATCLLFVAACGGSKDTTGPSATPSSIRSSAGDLQTATVGVALSVQLSVVVTDNAGNAVSGARVQWDAAAGSGSVNPGAVATDSRGVATTRWTLGTIAGPVKATAQIPGLNPVTFTATATAGAAANVITLPDAANLGVGDTVRLRSTVRDQYSNVIAAAATNYVSLDPAIASVASDGLVTGVAIGNTRVIVSGSGKADTVPVLVLGAGASVCGTIAPKVLALGEVFIPPAGASGVTTCIAAPPDMSGDYALTLISTSASYATVTSLDVYAIGNPLTTTALQSAPDVAPPTVGPTIDAANALATDAVRDAELSRRLLERRELAPLVSMARDWQASIAQSPSIQQLADVRVGDLIKLNGNANLGCTSPDTRTARVAAVGNRALVVADTANPSGGYTDVDYASIAATFDTLVYPLDTAAFGAPSNISQYGKIILFYTRNVNAQTPAGANYTIGGFFFARDLYPKTQRNGLAACGASNEQEMFYLLVPDPSGTVNNNKRTKDAVTALNLGTIAHEFEHLINSSRRLYVTPNAQSPEETWLDEGLAHTAEELLFFRISGYSSRQNLTLANVQAQATNFTNFASQNFARFYTFLISPETNSPYAPNDSLATRGATWNFLRFAAGRQGLGGENQFFRTLVNSPTVGLTNLNNALGGQLGDYLRDWTVSIVADDFSAAETAALGQLYILPAWNFRNIYPGLRFTGGTALGSYPLATRFITSNSAQRVSLVGGSSSYFRFSLGTGRSTLLAFSSNGGVVPSSVRYALVRLR